jgi:hypothetical protein
MLDFDVTQSRKTRHQRSLLSVVGEFAGIWRLTSGHHGIGQPFIASCKSGVDQFIEVNIISMSFQYLWPMPSRAFRSGPGGGGFDQAQARQPCRGGPSGSPWKG